MGYRSDGAWIINGKPENIRAAWAALKLSNPLPEGEIEDLWGEFKLYQKNGVGYIYFQFESWKWYDSFPSIQWYERVWEELSHEQWQLNGARIRLGEEDDDTEQDSFDNADGVDAPYIMLSRSWDTDVPTSGDPITN